MRIEPAQSTITTLKMSFAGLSFLGLLIFGVPAISSVIGYIEASLRGERIQITGVMFFWVALGLVCTVAFFLLMRGHLGCLLLEPQQNDNRTKMMQRELEENMCDTEVRNIYAFRRIVARIVDLFFVLLLMAAMGINNLHSSCYTLLRGVMDSHIAEWFFMFVLRPLFIAMTLLVYDTFLIRTTGTTIGKYAVGLQIRDTDGRVPSLMRSFHRAGWFIRDHCFLLLWYLTIPLATIHLFYSRKSGVSIWDKSSGTRIHSFRNDVFINVFMVVAIMGLGLTAMYWLLTFLNMMG